VAQQLFTRSHSGEHISISNDTQGIRQESSAAFTCGYLTARKYHTRIADVAG
jgi:hypothetical protein